MPTGLKLNTEGKPYKPLLMGILESLDLNKKWAKIVEAKYPGINRSERRKHIKRAKIKHKRELQKQRSMSEGNRI